MAVTHKTMTTQIKLYRTRGDGSMVCKKVLDLQELQSAKIGQIWTVPAEIEYYETSGGGTKVEKIDENTFLFSQYSITRSNTNQIVTNQHFITI